MTAQRTQGLGYKPDSIRQDYTGYQKDEESGGLEFAQARYYNTKHGRFTSIDPLTASANVKDPQTFNRYSYAMNSPYKFTDPLGLISETTGACGSRCANSGSTGGYSENYDSGHRNGPQLIEEAGIALRNELIRQRDKHSSDKHSGEREKGSATARHTSPSDLSTGGEPVSGVEPNSNDPSVVAQNLALARLLTDGNGIVRTRRQAGNEDYGGVPHFQFADGQIWAVHVYGDESGNVSGNVYVPKGFTVTFIPNSTDGTIRAYNPKTNVLINFLHIKGVNSQADLNKNMKTKNQAGSRLIGQTGGKNGDGPGYIHACIKVFNGYKGYDNYRTHVNGGRPSDQKRDYGDFRKLIN